MVTSGHPSNSRRFDLAPGLAETPEVLAMLQSANLLRMLAFPALLGLPRVAFSRVVSAVFFQTVTAKLRSMRSLADSQPCDASRLARHCPNTVNYRRFCVSHGNSYA